MSAILQWQKADVFEHWQGCFKRNFCAGFSKTIL